MMVSAQLRLFQLLLFPVQDRAFDLLLPGCGSLHPSLSVHSVKQTHMQFLCVGVHLMHGFPERAIGAMGFRVCDLLDQLFFHHQQILRHFPFQQFHFYYLPPWT